MLEKRTILNRYQSGKGGICIAGVLKTPERTPRHLISPLGPSWVATGCAAWRGGRNTFSRDLDALEGAKVRNLLKQGAGKRSTRL